MSFDHAVVSRILPVKAIARIRHIIRCDHLLAQIVGKIRDRDRAAAVATDQDCLLHCVGIPDCISDGGNRLALQV